MTFGIDMVLMRRAGNFQQNNYGKGGKATDFCLF
jgi:hypothetical protein